MSNGTDPGPGRVDLGQQRKRAKELVRAHRAGDEDAARRVVAHLPRASGATPTEVLAARLTLSEAQLVVAREAGFASWPRMVHEVRERTLEPAELTLALCEAALAGNEVRARQIVERAPLDLARACLVGDADAAVRLLEEGADVASRADGWSPLSCACNVRIGPSRAVIVQALIERGADVDDFAPSTDMESGRCTVLRGAAARQVDLALVELLLEASAKLDPEAVLDAAQLPPGVDEDAVVLRRLLTAKPADWVLHHGLARALRAGNFDAARVMLEAGGDPNFGGGWGSAGTDLHLSLLHEHPLDVLRMLLEHGADPARRDRDDRTALQVAVRLGREDAADLLRDHGATDGELEPIDRRIGAAMRGDGAALGALPAASPARRTDHQLLPWAARTGRDAAVPLLLSIGLDPNVPADDGTCALHVAAERGEPAVVRVLLEAGARVDLRDHEGNTPLDAALRGSGRDSRRAVVALLERAGASAASVRTFPTGDEELDESLRRSGAVELDLAADFERAVDAVVDGDEATLRELLDREPELVHARSGLPHRATLLHYLGANGVEDSRQRTPPNAVAILRLLLDAGAEPDVLCSSYGGGPAQTTLALLASSDHPARAGLQAELVRVLVEAGANPNGLDDDGLPVATAIGFRQEQSMRALADLARLDNPLFAAAAGRVDLLESRIEPGGRARDDAGYCRVPWLGMSRDPEVVPGQALVCAAKFGQLGVVEWLVERGVDPLTRPTDDHGPPLHEACFAGHGDVAFYLLERGADARERDHRFDSTAIGWALEAGHRELALRIAEHTEPDLIDACDLGLAGAVRRILERDPSLARGADGKGVPLRVAAYRGHLELVELLLEHGADPRAPNLRGQTAVDFARSRGHDEVLAALGEARSTDR